MNANPKTELNTSFFMQKRISVNGALYARFDQVASEHICSYIRTLAVWCTFELFKHSTKSRDSDSF